MHSSCTEVQCAHLVDEGLLKSHLCDGSLAIVRTQRVQQTRKAAARAPGGTGPGEVCLIGSQGGRGVI